MLQIEKYIKYLLYIKEGFVIPCLGYFYSQHIDFIYSLEEKLIKSKKKIFFFDSLKLVDKEDFFIKYISKKEKKIPEIVKSEINEYILYIKEKIKQNEKYTIQGLGLFYFNDKNEIMFTCDKTINFDISYFGLKDRPIRGYLESEKVFKEDISHNKENVIESEKPLKNLLKEDIKYFCYDETLDKNIDYVNNFWVKLILILYIVFGITYIMLNKDYLVFKNRSEIFNIENHQNNEEYHIIIASFDSSDIHKIKNYVKEFEKKNGEKKLELILDDKSKRYRVSYAKFKDKEEAYLKLKKIREFISDSWIYTIK